MSNHPQKSGSLCSGMSGSLCSGIGGSLYSGILIQHLGERINGMDGEDLEIGLVLVTWLIF